MKILAFSDWRIQSLTMLRELIRKENPELILYAGDDLDRFIGLENKFYIKTYNNFIEVDTSKLDDFFKNEKVAKNPKIRAIKEHIINLSSDFLKELKIPFIYVNGNDDCLIKKDVDYYLKVSESFWIENENYKIYEDLKGKVDVFPSQNYGEIFNTEKYKEKVIEDQKEYKIIPSLEGLTEDQLRRCSMYEVGDNSFIIERDCEDSDPLFRHNKDNGMYVKINPSFGKITYNNKSERLTIFGSECSFGLKGRIVNSPNENADIFLSHLPPLGALDLSPRHGLKHVGSKQLLESINIYKPKFVICGHSHIWGGVTEKFDGTTILNVSSQDELSYENEGNYAIINTDDWSHQIKTEKSLSLQKIRGFTTLKNKIKEKKFKLVPKEDIDKYDLLKWDKSSGNLYRPAGPETIKKADAFIKKIYKVKTIEEITKLFSELESFGINTSTIKSRLATKETGELQIKKSITLNPENYYFVDVETGRNNGFEPGRLWLIGVADGQAKEVIQFIYPHESELFFKYLKDNVITTLVSWSNFDQKVLSPIFESNQIKIQFFDACQRTSNALIWDKYQLHELYRDLFKKNRPTQEVIPGRIAGLYADHLIFAKKECPYCSNKKDRIIDEIKKRNKLDILQMIEICKFLYDQKVFECPNCDFKTKYKRSLNDHIKNNVCKKLSANKTSLNQHIKNNVCKEQKTDATFNESDLENLAHFNEYNVFICDCGKSYLCNPASKKKYILNHINSCPKFTLKTKNK